MKETPEYSIILGNVVKEARARSGITQSELEETFAPEIDETFTTMAKTEVARLRQIVARALDQKCDWRTERDAFQERMSVSCGILRDLATLERAKDDASAQLARLFGDGRTTVPSSSTVETPVSDDAIETLRNLQLCIAHKVYIDAIYESVAAGVGSRGSQITLDPTGTPISSVFPSNWRPQSEDQTFRKRVFYTFLSSSSNGNNSFATRCFWRDAKPIPEPDEWFENVWRDYREGKIYNRSRFDAGASGD